MTKISVFLLFVLSLLFNKHTQSETYVVNPNELTGVWVLPREATFVQHENYRGIKFSSESVITIFPSGDTVFYFNYVIKNDSMFLYHCDMDTVINQEVFLYDCFEEVAGGRCKILALSKDSLVLSHLLKDKRRLVYYKKP